MSRTNFLGGLAASCLFITTSMLAPSAGHAQDRPTAVLGPSGGTGGGPFFDPAPGNDRVARVTIHSGDFLEAVQMTLEKPDGTLHTLPHHGGSGGSEANLDLGAAEHIIKITGRFNQFVNHIKIITDGGFVGAPQRTLEGGRQGGGADFELDAPPGFEIVGFIGRSGTIIDAIGVIVRKLP
jgi:hypothetical protein